MSYKVQFSRLLAVLRLVCFSPFFPFLRVLFSSLHLSFLSRLPASLLLYALYCPTLAFHFSAVDSHHPSFQILPLISSTDSPKMHVSRTSLAAVLLSVAVSGVSGKGTNSSSPASHGGSGSGSGSGVGSSSAGSGSGGVGLRPLPGSFQTFLTSLIPLPTPPSSNEPATVLATQSVGAVSGVLSSGLVASTEAASVRLLTTDRRVYGEHLLTKSEVVRDGFCPRLLPRHRHANRRLRCRGLLRR